MFVAANASAPSSNPLIQKLAAFVAGGPPTSLGPAAVGFGGFDAPLQVHVPTNDTGGQGGGAGECSPPR
jgi:hypothetical protein